MAAEAKGEGFRSDMGEPLASAAAAWHAAREQREDLIRMRYIDAFCHFFPDALWQRMLELPGIGSGIGKRMRGVPAIYDLEERFRVMDLFRHHDYRQVISLGMPPLEQLGPPEVSVSLARLANDGLAELCRRFPDRFAGFLASGVIPADVSRAGAC